MSALNLCVDCHAFDSVILWDEGQAQEICYESGSLLFPGHNSKQTESWRRPLCDYSEVCCSLITELRQSCSQHHSQFVCETHQAVDAPAIIFVLIR